MTALPPAPPVNPGVLATWIHEMRQLTEEVDFSSHSHGLTTKSIAARLRVLLADMHAVAYQNRSQP